MKVAEDALHEDECPGWGEAAISEGHSLEWSYPEDDHEVSSTQHPQNPSTLVPLLKRMEENWLRSWLCSL